MNPILGRGFLTEEQQPGNEQVTILSYGLWQRRYGANRAIIGSAIALNGRSYVVVGVTPPGFSLFGSTRDDQLWVPFAYQRADLDRLDHEVTVFARLKDGIPVAKAQAEMAVVLARLKQEYPNFDQRNGVRVVRFEDDLVRGLGPAVILLMIAVALLLLIVCANVANLTLARNAVREREMAIRAAVGAGAGRIFRQILTESLLLALIGGGLGIVFAYVGLTVLRAELAPEGVYRSIRHPDWIGIDGTVLWFTLGVSLLTGVVFAMAPAFQIFRAALHDPLKEGGRGSSGGRRSRLLRSALVVCEVAVSLILLVGAGLLSRSLVAMLSEDMGFNPAHLLTMQVWLPQWRYASGGPVASFYDQLITQVNQLPGVKSASAVNFLPLTGWVDYCNFDIAGRARPPSGQEFTSQFRVVDQRYLATMGVPIKKGRDFQSYDGPNTAGVAIINEALARRYWPKEDPIGKKIRLIFPPTVTPWSPEPNHSWLTIVGIAGNIRDWSWSESEDGYLYLPYLQNPSPLMRLVLRTNGDPSALSGAVQKTLHAIDPNQPVTDILTMDQVLDRALSERKLSMFLLAVFAAVATLLAALGIYGVVAYGVAQRTHEIGIRMALGAQRANVLGMILQDGARLAAVGLLIGISGSLLTMRFLESQLYGVKASDPLTIVAVAVGLAVITVAACYPPARRATKVDPLVALRYE